VSFFLDHLGRPLFFFPDILMKKLEALFTDAFSTFHCGRKYSCVLCLPHPLKKKGQDETW
jgi:hypothetical protein